MEDEETATGMTLSPITATCSLSWNNYAPSPASTTGSSSPASMPPPANVVALQVIATAPPAPPSDNIINHHREDEAAHLTCSTIDTAIMGRMTAGSGRHRRHHGSRHLPCSPTWESARERPRRCTTCPTIDETATAGQLSHTETWKPPACTESGDMGTFTQNLRRFLPPSAPTSKISHYLCTILKIIAAYQTEKDISPKHGCSYGNGCTVTMMTEEILRLGHFIFLKHHRVRHEEEQNPRSRRRIPTPQKTAQDTTSKV